MIGLREVLKNLALLAPTRLLETGASYSVLRTSNPMLLPKEMVSGIPKHSYFDQVHRLLNPEKPLLFLEFGVYRGRSIGKWCQMNECPNSRFVGFDSFVGLPERWRQREAGYFDTQGKVPDIRDSRVTFVKGWFNRTLPEWLDAHPLPAPVTHSLVVHIDSDLYSSALYVLTRLHDAFPRYHVLFDNYGAGEAKALRDYIMAYGATFEPILGRKLRRYSRIPGQVFGILQTNGKVKNEANDHV